MGKREEGEALTAHGTGGSDATFSLEWAEAPAGWLRTPPRLNMLCFQSRGLEKQEVPMVRAAQAPLAEGNHFFLNIKNPEADFMSDAHGRARSHRSHLAHFVLYLESEAFRLEETFRMMGSNC